MFRPFLPDGDIVVADQKLLLGADRGFIPRIVGEDDGDGCLFQRNHPVGPFTEACEDAIDASGNGVTDDVWRQFGGMLHELDCPVVPGVDEIEHARKAVSSGDVANGERDDDVLRFHRQVVYHNSTYNCCTKQHFTVLIPNRSVWYHLWQREDWMNDETIDSLLIGHGHHSEWLPFSGFER